MRSEEHTSELQSLRHLVCRLLLPAPSTLFPYTTLFRSAAREPDERDDARDAGASRWPLVHPDRSQSLRDWSPLVERRLQPPRRPRTLKRALYATDGAARR